MSTRLYLPSSGSAPLGSLAVDASWTRTDNLVRLPCGANKSDTALTEKSATWQVTTTVGWVWVQFQSPPMAEAHSWTVADTISMVVKVAEAAAQVDSHLAYCIRVVSNDGSVIRGTIGELLATSTEYPISYAAEATRIHSARTNGASAFSSQIGDRIVIEIGHWGVTPAANIVYHTYGDPTATEDYALTVDLTTDLCPWVELSRTVLFGSILTVAEGSHTHTADNVSLSSIPQLVIGDSSNTHTSSGMVLTVESSVTVASCDHTHTGENVSLGITSVLEVLNGSAEHVSDNITLGVTCDLVVAECSHTHLADNVTVSTVLPVYLRPSADALDGTWTNELGSQTNLYDSVNEESASDSDYIQSVGSPQNSPVVLKLSAGADPSIHTAHVLHIRYGKVPDGTTEVVSALFELRQGYVNESSMGTLIADWTYSDVGFTMGTVDLSLTELQAGNISDYGDLFVRIMADVV